VSTPNFRYSDVDWASDGNRLVVRASRGDGPSRMWLQQLGGGAPTPITPEGVDGLFLTVNHTDYVAARDHAGTMKLYPIEGGDPQTISGVTTDEDIIGGSNDSSVVCVSRRQSAVSLQISKLNIVSGNRQPFVRVSPNNPAGVIGVGRPIFTRDEKRYVYLQVRSLSVLYVASRVK